MRKLTVCLTLCLLLGLLASCQPRPASPPDYRTTGFTAELAWQAGALSLCAVASVEGATDNAPARVTTLRFTAPPALKGVVLSREAGAATVECHGMTASAEALEALWRTAQWLTASGTVTPVAITEQTGERLLYAERPTEDGEGVYGLYLDPKSGIPHQIRLGDETLEIRSFTPRP